MPDLEKSFYAFDIGRLRIIARFWGVELSSSEADSAARELAINLLVPERVHELVASLATEVQSALFALVSAGGKLPWSLVVRQIGEIREVGPGRRDREQPYLNPLTPSEGLYYRGLISRDFFDTPSGPQEFGYIPEDLLKLVRCEFPQINLPGASENSIERVVGPYGRPASPRERECLLPICDTLLDDATTLLAALRMDMVPPETSIPVKVVRSFLLTAGILEGGEPAAERVKQFLEWPRAQAMSALTEAWMGSEQFNELRHLPGLIFEGEWSNNPKATRGFLIRSLESIPEDKWWSLPAFIRAVKEANADFQRPAGDYDSWFIKRAADGVYLRGFSSWDDVDGALIRYLITGPCFWLGMVELASAEEGGAITAFRILSNAARTRSIENGKIQVTSQGRVFVPRLVPRAVRYQVARFCEWDNMVEKPALDPRLEEKNNNPQKDDLRKDYRYRVTTFSLDKAVQQGLKVNQLLGLLSRNSSTEIPPSFVRALKRWENNGTEARIDLISVLRVNRPEVLDELRKSKAGRFLGESLGPVAVIVKPGATSKVLSALTEMGLLAGGEVEEF